MYVSYYSYSYSHEQVLACRMLTRQQYVRNCLLFNSFWPLRLACKSLLLYTKEETNSVPVLSCSKPLSAACVVARSYAYAFYFDHCCRTKRTVTVTAIKNYIGAVGTGRKIKRWSLDFAGQLCAGMAIASWKDPFHCRRWSAALPSVPIGYSVALLLFWRWYHWKEKRWRKNAEMHTQNAELLKRSAGELDQGAERCIEGRQVCIRCSKASQSQ